MKVARISVLMSGLIALVSFGFREIKIEAADVKRKLTANDDESNTKVDQLVHAVDVDLFQKKNPYLVATSFDR